MKELKNIYVIFIQCNTVQHYKVTWNWHSQQHGWVSHTCWVKEVECRTVHSITFPVYEILELENLIMKIIIKTVICGWLIDWWKGSLAVFIQWRKHTTPTEECEFIWFMCLSRFMFIGQVTQRADSEAKVSWWQLKESQAQLVFSIKAH